MSDSLATLPVRQAQVDALVACQRCGAYVQPGVECDSCQMHADMAALIAKLPKREVDPNEPKCPQDFDLNYPGAERIDLDGYCVWAAYLGRHDGVAISEPVLTDAQAFEFAHGVPATPENLQAIAEHDETHIEERATESARESYYAGLGD